MYAVAHDTTALAIKRYFPKAPLPALLISVQAVELLWIVFTYLGVEKFTTTANAVHLNFLPYSHSIGTGVGLAVLVFLVCAVAKHPRLGLALALGVVSHVVLDLIHHETDISLLPFASSPRFGLDLQGTPWVDLAVETAYGIACWFIFKGSIPLLASIIVLNLLNAPIMNPMPGMGAFIGAHRWMLPTLILFQFLLTSVLFIWLAPDHKPDEQRSKAWSGLPQKT